MGKSRLLKLIKTENDIDAINMILSNYVDFGSSVGGLVSVNQFNKYWFVSNFYCMQR